MGTHLITGGTGTFGQALALELLQRRTQDDLYFIVRHRPGITPRTRLVNTLIRAASAYHREDLIPSIKARVHAVAGDITYANLRHAIGMPTEAETIWHCAATPTHHPVNYQQATNVNVHGTQNILDLAARMDPSAFIYLSSAYVAGSRQITAPEEPPSPWNSTCENTASKIRAELTVLTEPRFHTIVMRPALLMGHSSLRTYSGSTTGPFLACRYLSAAATHMRRPMTVPLDGLAPCNFIHVNDAVRLACDIWLSPGRHRIFHLANPYPLNQLSAITALFEAANAPLPYLNPHATPTTNIEAILYSKLKHYFTAMRGCNQFGMSHLPRHSFPPEPVTGESLRLTIQSWAARWRKHGSAPTRATAGSHRRAG